MARQKSTRSIETPESKAAAVTAPDLHGPETPIVATEGVTTEAAEATIAPADPTSTGKPAEADEAAAPDPIAPTNTPVIQPTTPEVEVDENGADGLIAPESPASNQSMPDQIVGASAAQSPFSGEVSGQSQAAPSAEQPPNAGAMPRDEGRPTTRSVPDPSAPASPTPAQSMSAPSRAPGRLVPLVLGGAIAAALGFGAAAWLFGRDSFDPSSLEQRLALQEAASAELQQRLATLPALPDLAPLDRDLAELRSDLVAGLDGLRPALSDLSTRIDTLERAPSGDGTLTDAALAAWQEELSELRGALDAQSARTDALAAEASARIEAQATTLAEVEAQAASAGQDIIRRAALSRVLAALDSGQPYDAALAEATAGGAAAPAALAGPAADGVPTLARLIDTFPDAARAALALAREEGISGEAGGIAGFLRSQFQVRSTRPQDGTTPDAILSRADAALHAGDLSAARAELAALPEVLRGAMADWLTLADIRSGAVEAAQSAMADLTDTPSGN